MLGKGYFFYGNESFLISEEVQSIKQMLKSANINYFENDIDFNKVLQATQTTGLFASETLIIIKNPIWLKNKLTDTLTKQWVELFKTTISKQTCIIICNYTAVDMRKKIPAILKKTFISKQLEPFKDWEQDKLLQWITTRIKKKNKSISAEALEMLATISGNSLEKCASEIETLCVYIASKNQIEIQDIKSFCTQEQATLYEFSESIKNKNYSVCYKLLQNLKRSGEDPIKLLGLVSANFRLYFYILSNKHIGEHQIAKQLGKHPFFIKQILKTIEKKYTVQKVGEIIKQLATCDYEIKSGQKKADFLFYKLPFLISN
tara:strand:- start:1458 stop:2411 length:954 start_codon:yes stop_codon:yes gene_type:complete